MGKEIQQYSYQSLKRSTYSFDRKTDEKSIEISPNLTAEKDNMFYTDYKTKVNKIDKTTGT